MVKPKPISLRLRPDELTKRARAILERVDKEIAAQERVKFLATRALNEIYQMDAAAEPKLKTMSADDRGDWRANYLSLTSILQKIRMRGVW